MCTANTAIMSTTMDLQWLHSVLSCEASKPSQLTVLECAGVCSSETLVILHGD